MPSAYISMERYQRQVAKIQLMHSSNKFPSRGGVAAERRRGGYYNLYTARTRKYCKKKRELKSFQNQLFEEIFDDEIIY